MAQPPTPFGIVPAGLPVITAPAETPSPTSFLYAIPPPPPSSSSSPAAPTTTTKPSTHIVVFLLPGIVLPPNTAAAIYLVPTPGTPAAAQPPRFLGAIGPGKESAIFKLSTNAASTTGGPAPTLLGISIEDAASVAAQMEAKAAAAAATTTSQPTTTTDADASSSSALVPARPPTLLLAQRIIQNAFNFLASYGSTSATPNGAIGEVVPLRAFEEWWRKFEGRLRSDPTFLERAVE